MADSAEIRKILGTTLLYWDKKRNHPWTIGDATEGCQIFGATGSGKSSGSGRKIAKTFLRSGFGGLVLCAKKGEREEWEEYARQEKQSHRLVFFTPKSGYQFNPLFFEQFRDGEGAGETMNLTNLVMTLYELSRGFMSGGSGGKDERFWDNALRRSIARMVDLIKLNKGASLSFSSMQRVLTSAPSKDEVDTYNQLISILNSPESGPNDRNIALDELSELTEKSYCLDLVVKADTGKGLSEDEKLALNLVKNYFLKEYPNLSDRTKAIISESFLGLVEPFLQGMLYNNFSGALSPEIAPELSYEENKIIILDFPVKEHLLAGVYAQGVYKYCWMQQLERRNIFEENNPKPCFLWVDESQFFVNPEYDSLFQSTARSSLVCTVYLTQNLNNYYLAMGTNNPEARAKSMLGNLNTKIFHANGDPVTNEWASKTIGETFQNKETLQKKGFSPNNTSITDALYAQVLPQQFTTLKRGGQRKNGFKTEAIIFSVGANWSDDKNFLRVEFDQNE